MSDMPADTSQLLSHFYLKLDGADASEDLITAVLTVTVESSLHLPDVATIVLEDTRQRWIDEESLGPGKALEVSSRGESGEVKIFEGEIVELEPDFGPSMQRLVVRAFDRLHRLSRGRYVRTFLNTKDSDIANRIGGEVGLQVRAASTPQVHPYVIQANETNLSFLQKRAAALGYLLYVKGRTLHFEPPAPAGPPVELQWAVGLNEFHPRMTTMEQVNNVTVRSWNWQDRQEIVGQVQNGRGHPEVGESRTGGQLAQNGFNLTAPHLVTHQVIRVQDQAERLAQAVADRHAGRFIEAEGVGAGNPAITAGASVRISAVGRRFSGTYYVTAATHRFDASHTYKTHFSVSGQNPNTLLALLASAHEDPPAPHLAIGIVTNNDDPEGLCRVKVKFPWLSVEHESDWARIAVPGGGNERGIEFLPEVNEEVLVGFELGDIHHPYILGYLWNGKDKPPIPNSEIIQGGKVMKRVIYSRTGHKVIIDDEDGGGGIIIQDRNDNIIQLDTRQNKLFIEVAGNVEMKAQGDIKMTAQGKVEIESGMNVKIQGSTTVDVTAGMINLN